MVVIEWILEKVGLTTRRLECGTRRRGQVAVAVLAVLVAAGEVAGDAVARAAAPFVVLVPAVIWWQTADAFFAGVSAWAVTLVILATGRKGARADLFAVAGGLLFGITAFLSYGLVLLAFIPVAVCAVRRTPRPLVLACWARPTVSGVRGPGFSWFSGLAATRAQYWRGVASIARTRTSSLPISRCSRLRPARRSRSGSPACATGTSGCSSVVRSPSIALADLSGMSKAEVERIWLPFVPWVALAAGGTGRAVAG